MISLKSISITGAYRKKNDDRVSHFENDDFLVALVCDGMGGHLHGDIAAEETAKIFTNQFSKNFSYISFQETSLWLKNVVNLVKKRFKDLIKSDFSKERMGTTLTGVLILKKIQKIIVFHIGDSRCYFYTKEKKLVQITQDHSYENKLLSAGISLEEAKSNPKGRLLTSVLSLKNKITFNIYDLDQIDYAKVDKIILTSDGAHEFISSEEFKAELKSSSSEKNANSLVEIAQKNDSTDNISCIVINLGE